MSRRQTKPAVEIDPQGLLVTISEYPGGFLPCRFRGEIPIDPRTKEGMDVTEQLGKVLDILETSELVDWNVRMDGSKVWGLTDKGKQAVAMLQQGVDSEEIH